jgi:hypothetical protein
MALQGFPELGEWKGNEHLWSAAEAGRVVKSLAGGCCQ